MTLPKFPGQKGPLASKVLRVSNLVQLEEQAAESGELSSMVYDYYASGAETESAVRDNRDAFSRFKLIPRMLKDVSDMDLKLELLGCNLDFPVMVAPMAMQQMAHNDGECAMSKACKACGTVMVLSTMANYSVSDVHAATGGAEHMWFQLYVFRDREFVTALVKEAERLGYRALVVTVDAPFLGNREADETNSFRMPPGLSLGNAKHAKGVAGRKGGDAGSELSSIFMGNIDDSLTWELITFLKSVCKLPVLVKGILHPEDAALAVSHGADGVVVSNHGGRQLDYAVSPLDALPAIAAAVGGRVPIILDGGVRRGTDVLKALALGANAVAVGRPMLYALARAGQEGVEQALLLIRGELNLAMALAGVRSLKDISRALVVHESELPLRSRL